MRNKKLRKRWANGEPLNFDNREIDPWLAEYAEVQSELNEDVFENSEDSEGENATRTYSIIIKLNLPIPHFLPIDGRRVKVHYRAMRKLCTNCFYQHLKINCKNEKVKWIDYVKWFVSKNPEFSNEQYGRWIQILEKEDKQQDMSMK